MCRAGASLPFRSGSVPLKDLLGSIPGFYESARAHIASLILQTYSRLSKRTLADCLKLEPAALDTYVSWAAADP
jgi:hypothetical protein